MGAEGRSYKEKDDAALAEAVQGGDAGAAEELFSRYKDAVQVAARKYFMLGADRDDVVQEGMIGLFKAMQTFNASAGASFATYTGICIRNQIINAMEASAAKRHAPLNSSVSLDGPLWPCDSDEGEDALRGSCANMLPAGLDSNPAEQAVFRETMNLILSDAGKLLSPFEKQVARQLVDGRTHSETASLLGVSPKSVYNASQRIKRKLREFFIDDIGASD